MPSKSGNPAKKAAAKKAAAKKAAATKKSASTRQPSRRMPATGVSSVSDFKKKTDSPSADRAANLLTLPSGLSAVVQNRGFRTFIRKGIIPNPLMGIVEEAISKGQPPDMESLKNEEGNLPLETVDNIYELMDAVVVDCFVEPPVYPVPSDEPAEVGGAVETKDPNLLYVDEIDDLDKMFLFNWVSGGTRDVEQFRDELGDDVVDLPGGQTLVDQAKLTTSTGRARR